MAASEGVQVAGNLLYLKPMLTQAEDKNPYALEDRKFPVDFGAPREETYLLSLTLPAGYQADELPKPALLSLPDNGGRFTYNVALNGNVLQVISKISIKKPMFGADEYAALKQFYQLIVAKHAEQVVLRKN